MNSDSLSTAVRAAIYRIAADREWLIGRQLAPSFEAAEPGLVMTGVIATCAGRHRGHAFRYAEMAYDLEQAEAMAARCEQQAWAAMRRAS